MKLKYREIRNLKSALAELWQEMDKTAKRLLNKKTGRDVGGSEDVSEAIGL